MNFSSKVVVSSTVFLLISGCSSILEQQTAKMDSYRSTIDQERLMSKEVREQQYRAQLWYNPELWQAQNSAAVNKKQRTQDFFGCVQAAEEIEKGISDQIGGIDPIQTIHARATIEVCMVSKKYRAVDSQQKLICESSESDVLPICDFSHDLILDYRN